MYIIILLYNKVVHNEDSKVFWNNILFNVIIFIIKVNYLLTIYLFI